MSGSQMVSSGRSRVGVLQRVVVQAFVSAENRWFGPVVDESTSDQDCMAAQMLWWDPRILPRASS